MSLISTWSTTPNANGTLGSTPYYWPEGQAPSTVNDCARQMMATIRTQWNDAAWFDWGYTVTRVSGNSFTVATASWNTVTLPAAFEANARIKCADTAGNFIYGTITTVSVSAASTQVTFTPDAHSLTATVTNVANSIIPASNTPIPGLNIPTDVITQKTQQIFGVDMGVTNAASITLSPVLTSYVNGQLINFQAAATNTGATTLNVNGLGAIAIKKNVNTDLVAGDITIGQMISVLFDGTHFQLQASSGAAGNFISQNMAQIYGIDNGVTNSFSVSLSPALAAYTAGQVVNFNVAFTNTGACNLNVNGVGIKAVKKFYNQDLVAGDVVAHQLVSVEYDGTNFQMLSPVPAGGSISTARGWVAYSTSGAANILASYNVTSLTYNAVGDVTVNFTTAMPGANYSGTYSTGRGASAGSNSYVVAPYTANPTTTTFRAVTVNSAGGAVDAPYTSGIFYAS